jgi:hypothetical protein
MGIECSVPGRSQSRMVWLPYPGPPRLTNLGESRGRVTAHDLSPRDFTTGFSPSRRALDFGLAHETLFCKVIPVRHLSPLVRAL